MKNSIELLISFVLKPFVILWFWFLRWFRYNKLLNGLNNKKIGMPSVFYFPFAYFYKFSLLIKRIWAAQFSSYALKKYTGFLKIHYSKDGLGYFDYKSLSPDDYLKIYQNLTGRVSYYIAHNPAVLDYKDGDSFLDAGCGKGQNIKELVRCFPNSPVKGFDVSKEALKVIQTALKDNRNVSVEESSVSDIKYLASYPDGAFDHVIISHVFAFLIGSGINETKDIRQMIIDQLIRIAAKSLLIMDGDILSDNKAPEIIIEQNTRCVFKESILAYFLKHFSKGELYSMFSPENEAVIFKKSAENK
jgi:SAM-dependent methyltransferase